MAAAGSAGHRKDHKALTSCSGVALAWVVAGIALAALLVMVPLHYYNRGIVLRNRCTESFSNVETELKRRYDLIPNLVAAVKGYVRHEREVLEEVVRLRATALADHGDPGHQADSERPLVRALDRLLALAEDNPTLKASKNFMQLQGELAITEDRIQAARRFYNGNVRAYRDHTGQFPGSVFARMYRFSEVAFFEVDPVVHAVPTVAA